MSQSLYAAKGGISAAQTQLEVISNNIANLNTTGFKASSVNFSDVFSTTISSGSVSTASAGGTNPIQVGVGVRVSSVSKNFNSGSWVSTGKNTDLMLQGHGFFTVQSSDGQVYYTRAGDFSFDNAGNLVTSSGYKVLGTDSILSARSSANTVYVPQSIIASVVGNVTMGNKTVNSLNNCGLTAGAFNITTTGGTDPDNYTINLDANNVSTDTVTQLITDIQNQIDTQNANSGITVGVSNGQITFDVNDTNCTAMSFSNPTTGASNFIVETGFNNSMRVPASLAVAGTYSSNILDYTVDVTQVTSASSAASVTNYCINADGSIQATYSNGDTLAVQLDDTGSVYEFVYTTSDGVEINGTNCNVDPNVAVPANFVVQLASVTNPDGLISMGSNLYESGPNAGDILYSVGGQMGIGKIESGGLEASNVDLSTEFSNMIVAQRAVEANSRVFTTTSDVLSTVVQMGR